MTPRTAAGKACSKCGDPEPHHVHNGDLRIEDYFTVGRGQTDFQAALSWQRKYLTAKAEARREPLVLDWNAVLFAVRLPDKALVRQMVAEDYKRGWVAGYDTAVDALEREIARALAALPEQEEK